LLDQTLRPAKPTKAVFDTLDRQYREQGKPSIWFLPIKEPIAPHLDELLGPAKTVKEVLDCDLVAEMSARALYEEAATHCHGVRDYVSRDLFEKLMHDEEEHIDFLETQLDLVAKLGVELYAQHHIGELEHDKD